MNINNIECEYLTESVFLGAERKPQPQSNPAHDFLIQFIHE